jgi:hypothetical protein
LLICGTGRNHSGLADLSRAPEAIGNRQSEIGNMTTLATEQDGLWSVLGMKVDPARRALWVTSTAFPQMVNFKKQEDGSSAVFKFDLKTGKLIKRYVVPDASRPHALGDLTIESNGDVFSTDSLTPAVYVIRPKKDEIELLDCLIGVQNGVAPQRVVRLRLTKDLKRVERCEVLEANNPLFDEPTLGALVNEYFYFIANSQWGLVDDKAQLGPAEKLADPIILKIKL